jgi:hypothetical protein
MVHQSSNQTTWIKETLLSLVCTEGWSGNALTHLLRYIRARWVRQTAAWRWRTVRVLPVSLISDSWTQFLTLRQYGLKSINSLFHLFALFICFMLLFEDLHYGRIFRDNDFVAHITVMILVKTKFVLNIGPFRLYWPILIYGPDYKPPMGFSFNRCILCTLSTASYYYSLCRAHKNWQI